MSVPLVLVHGAGLDHRVWARWVELLAPYPVVTPSLPGRMGVPGPPCVSVAESVAHLSRELSRRGVDRFVIAGHSYGSAIALSFAIAHPERVAGLVLMSSGARLRVHPSILSALREGRDPMTGAPWAKDTPIETALADWEAVNAFDRLGEPLDVRAPTLVIAGEHDALIPPKFADYLLAHIAGSELLRIDGVGHDAPFERPEPCVERVQALLTRGPAVAAGLR